MSKYHFRDSSFISAVSVALVLFLIGAECVLLLIAGALVTRTREDMTIVAELTVDADSAQCAQLEVILSDQNRFRGYTFISKEQALEDHIRELGEDPREILGEDCNPFYASYEIHPTDLYSHPDSMAHVAAQLKQLPYVEETHYPEQVADMLTHKVERISFVLLIVALVLLLIALVLIINTIRLQIYAKRFIINTMTLVGATSWVTRRPFVWRSVLTGALAALAALMLIGGAVYYLKAEWNISLFPWTYENIGFVVAVVMGSGLLITLFASLIATGRYIRMDNNSLYEV